MSPDVFSAPRKASLPLLTWSWVWWVPSCLPDGRDEPKSVQRSLSTDSTRWEVKSLLLSGNQFASLKMRGLDQRFPKLEHSSND